MSEKKMEQAARLFEALEGVDPELLARSEKEKKIIPFQRYVRVAATFFALLVAGGLGWITLRYAGGKTASDSAKIASDVSGNMSVAGNAEKYAIAKEEESFDEAADSNYEMAQEDGNWANDMANAESWESEMTTQAEEIFENVAGNSNSMTEQNSIQDLDAMQVGAESSVKYGGLIQGLKEWMKAKEGGTREPSSGSIGKSQSMEMVLTVDGKEYGPLADQSVAAALYDFLTESPMEACDGDVAMKNRSENGSIQIVADGGADGEEVFLLEGNVLTKGGSEVYLILDEEYDFDELKAGLLRIMEEE